MSFLSGTRPWNIAHRGLALTVPENTLAAFRHALSAGATHLETDVRASADGHAILCHDSTITDEQERVVHVNSASLREIHQHNLGSGETVPTLREALVTFPETRFNIDIKEPRCIPDVIAALREHQALDRVLITSFSASRRTHVVDQLVSVATSPSAAEVFTLVSAARLKTTRFLRSAARRFTAIQIPRRYGAVNLVTRSTVNAFHRVGLDVHVWTIDAPQEMRDLLAFGVDGIVTNRCDVLQNVIAQRQD